MRTKIILLMVAFLVPLGAHAQWSVGVTGGMSYNVLSMDRQYLTDNRVDGLWGATMGVSGQYDINDWLAVRAGLNLTQKNYRQHRVILTDVDYRYQNDYLQLPVMASFSFGGQKLRGLFHLGVYGGYWLQGYLRGHDYNLFNEETLTLSQDVDFNPDRDQRWDFGFLGGIGLEYRIARHWAVRAESLGYYSVVSTTRQYMRVQDYRYNTTVALQLGVSYLF
jgi:opacity protein-like surface antigen